MAACPSATAAAPSTTSTASYTYSYSLRVPRSRCFVRGGQGRLQRRRRPPAAPQAAAGVEFVPFETLQKSAVYDLRLINPHPVARTPYQRRDDGFLALGSYMTAAGMRETQPLLMTHAPGGGKTMQVYLAPKQPLPLDQLPPPPPPVELDVAGAEVVAVGRFEGNATREACEAARAALLAALQRDGLALAPDEAAGQFRVAQYGEIHSLGPRLNEIWLGVAL